MLSRRSFLVGAGVAASAGAAPRLGAARDPNPRRVPPETQTLIDRERQSLLAAMKTGDIPGAAVCFIYEGRPVWIEGFGVTDRRSNRKIGDGTIFSIQSCSKNFTATAILVAVQRGLLDLDAPITTYLPDFTVQSRFEAAPERKITLRLLLSHRAGFTHEAPVGNNYDPTCPGFEAHVASISRTWLRFPVGERYRYSNLGVDLAGYILQTVCKKPFADCLRTMLFDPLGMAHTTADPAVYTRRANRAIGHEAGYVGVPLRIPLIPSGGVYTSARDIAAYLSLHLNKGHFGGKRILEEKLWEEMHRISPDADYGLGVARIGLSYGDQPVDLLAHNGGGFGFSSRLNYLPEEGLAWASFFNRADPAASIIGGVLLDQVLLRRHGARRARLRARDLPVVDPPLAQLERLVGNYIGRAFSTQLKVENGKLVMQFGPAFVPLVFTSPVDLFFRGLRTMSASS